MKKVLFGVTTFILLFVMAACSKTSASTSTTKGTAALSTEAELVVGTFKLEGTDQAVTADQAKSLLPLWQTLQSLSTSNTAATEEINALVDQIKGTMTAGQMEKITAMKLTQQDVMTAMNDAGVGFNPSGASGTPNPSSGSNQGVIPGGGAAPSDGGGFTVSGGGPAGGGSGGGPSGDGAPPAGGFVIQGDPGGAGGPPGQSTTPQAVRSNGFASQVPPPLLNALIQLLQKKIQ
jgi:hypothetical protein